MATTYGATPTQSTTQPNPIGNAPPWLNQPVNRVADGGFGINGPMMNSTASGFDSSGGLNPGVQTFQNGAYATQGQPQQQGAGGAFDPPSYDPNTGSGSLPGSPGAAFDPPSFDPNTGSGTFQGGAGAGGAFDPPSHDPNTGSGQLNTGFSTTAPPMYSTRADYSAPPSSSGELPPSTNAPPSVDPVTPGPYIPPGGPGGGPTTPGGVGIPYTPVGGDPVTPGSFPPSTNAPPVNSIGSSGPGSPGALSKGFTDYMAGTGVDPNSAAGKAMYSSYMSSHPADQAMAAGADGVRRGSQVAYEGGPSVSMTGVDLNDPSLTALNTDFGSQEDRAAKAAYGSATQFMDEDFGRERDQIQSQLINQGFAPGSQAFNTQMGLALRSQDQARQTAAMGAVGVGNTEAGNLFARALQARQQQIGERGSEADRENAQSMGAAGLGVTTRGQDLGYKQSQNALAAGNANAASSASVARDQLGLRQNEDSANLDLQMRQLGLSSNNQNFNQLMQIIASSRGGVNMPNFGSPNPLDVTGAAGAANQATQIGNASTAARNAGLYGLGSAALSGLGSYFGGSP